MREIKFSLSSGFPPLFAKKKNRVIYASTWWFPVSKAKLTYVLANYGKNVHKCLPSHYKPRLDRRGGTPPDILLDISQSKERKGKTQCCPSLSMMSTSSSTYRYRTEMQWCSTIFTLNRGILDFFYFYLFNTASNPGLLRLRSWQSDALTTRLDLIHKLPVDLIFYFNLIFKFNCKFTV